MILLLFHSQLPLFTHRALLLQDSHVNFYLNCLGQVILMGSLSAYAPMQETLTSPFFSHHRIEKVQSLDL